MAKVLLCFSSHLFVDGEFRLVSYYEGLIKELVKHGNQVMVCNSAEFLKKSWNADNEESVFINKQDLSKAVKEFEPDIVISFNNSKLSIIEELCSCPIVIWEADSFSFYNDQKRILKNPNRYLYFCLSSNVYEQLKSIGVCDNNIFMINSGTAVYKEDLDFSANTSFIGSNFSGPIRLAHLLREHNTKKVKDAVKYLASNFYVDPEIYLNEHGLSFVLDYINSNEFGMINSCQNRIDVLNAINELGLELYGGLNWLDTVSYSPQLALSFNPKSIYSLKHNQDIYNSSRLCLNVSHAQAVDGFSWRVMDIMASNGCLLSNYNAGIKKFTKGYVDLPMYRSSGEAHTLAKRLLKDEVYRKELVTASQACIEDKGRWVHRFSEIEEAVGVKLINQPGVTGEIIWMNRYNYISSAYRLYSELIVMAAKSTPKFTHEFLYKLALKLGLKVDYQLVKSVMEQDNV